MGDEEATQPAGSAVEAEGDRPNPGTKRKARKRASTPAADPAAALDARLAAFGEAFMDSIDEPEVRPRKKQQPCQEPFGNQGASARKKKKKRRQKSLDAEGTSAGAGNTVGTPSSPTSKATAPPAAGAAKGAAKGSAGPAGSSRAGIEAQLAFLGEGPSDGKAAGPLAAPPRPAPGMSKAERRRFMSGKISDIRSDKQKNLGNLGGRRGREDPEEDAEFKKTLKQVLNFVTPQLDINARKQWEEAKVRALGGTIDKRRKINYRVLQRSSKKLEAERLEKVNQDKELGIVSHASKHRTVWQVDKLKKKRAEELKDKKKRRKQDDIFRLGMGAREKKGLFTIPQREIKSFKRRSGKR